MCLNNKKTFGKVYNVASGTKIQVSYLLSEELKAFGYDPSAYPIKFDSPTPGDTFGIYADIKAIRDDIGWQPKVSLETGLKLMTEWAILMKNET